jgi:hypothetical protein
VDDLRDRMRQLIDARSLRRRGRGVVLWLSFSGLLGLALFAALGAYALLRPSPQTWPLALVSVGGVMSMVIWLWQLWRA